MSRTTTEGIEELRAENRSDIEHDLDKLVNTVQFIRCHIRLAGFEAPNAELTRLCNNAEAIERQALQLRRDLKPLIDAARK